MRNNKALKKMDQISLKGFMKKVSYPSSHADVSLHDVLVYMDRLH